MPLTLSSTLQTHLDGELQTLVSLWTITRRDGTVLRFTDHDKNLVFNGATFVSGVGYDRSAVEDKIDLSVDNMDIKGIFDDTLVKRNDVRGGLFDGARVTIQLVNWKDLSQGSITRRTGWLGTAKQNNLGQFDVELRGLTQALSEGLTLVYTPACPVDLGSTRCQALILPTADNERVSGASYSAQQWMHVPAYPDYVWRATNSGATEEETTTNFAVFNAGAEGETVTDGTVVWESIARFDRTFTVTSGGDRKRFSISVDEPRSDADLDWFVDGALTFTSGDNVFTSKGVKRTSQGSAGDIDIELHLRAAFNVEAGDTGTIIPGCAKTILDCGNKFNNALNYQGHPYIPGENYLKKYPNAK